MRLRARAVRPHRSGRRSLGLAPTSEVEPSAAKQQYQDNDEEKCICAHLVFRNPAVFCVCATCKPIPRERTSSDVVLNAFTDDSSAGIGPC